MAYFMSLASDTVYASYKDTNLLETWGGPELTPLDPLPAIWSASARAPTRRSSMRCSRAWALLR